MAQSSRLPHALCPDFLKFFAGSHERWLSISFEPGHEMDNTIEGSSEEKPTVGDEKVLVWSVTVLSGNTVGVHSS